MRRRSCPGSRGALPRIHARAAAATQLRRVARAARGLRPARAGRCPAPPRTPAGSARERPRAAGGRAAAAPCGAPLRWPASPGTSSRACPVRCSGRAPTGSRPESGKAVADGQSGFSPLAPEDPARRRSSRAHMSATTRSRSRDARRGPLGDLRRRIYLTYTHFGLRTLVFRALTLPLRFTPLERRMRLRTHARDQDLRRAREWYREHGRPVDVVIPSYRDADPRGPAGAQHPQDEAGRQGARDRRRRLQRSRAPRGPARDRRHRRGGGVRAQRRLRGQRQPRDRGQRPRARRGGPELRHGGAAGVARVPAVRGLTCSKGVRGSWAPSSSTRTGGSSSAGRSAIAISRSGSTTATASSPSTGGRPGFRVRRLRSPGRACTYAATHSCGSARSTRPTRWPTRTWTSACERGWPACRSCTSPSAQLVHHEAQTRGTDLGVRERESQRVFWERWSDFFDDARASAARPRSPDAADREAPPAPSRRTPPLRIVYVTEDTGVGGGHRDVFEHLNRLAARGHQVSLYTLGDAPEWFPLQAPVRSFEDYRELGDALAELDAIKVATWWMTAAPVWRASIVARAARVFRPGHRDVLLPRPRAGAPRGARLLPPGVPLHDDLQLEPRAPARARSGRGADPPGDRSAGRSARARRFAVAGTWCSRWAARTR